MMMLCDAIRMMTRQGHARFYIRKYLAPANMSGCDDFYHASTEETDVCLWDGGLLQVYSWMPSPEDPVTDMKILEEYGYGTVLCVLMLETVITEDQYLDWNKLYTKPEKLPVHIQEKVRSKHARHEIG